MKKALITILLIVGLTGCSNTPTVKDTTTAAPTQTTTAVATTAPGTKAPETKPTTTTAPAQEAGIGKTIVFKDFEITVKAVEAIKTYDDKDAIRIVYDFKNLKDEAVMPMMAASINAYQKGVELSMAFVTEGNDNSSKNIRKDALVEDVYANFESDPVQGDIIIEIKPTFSFDSKEKAEFTIPYPAE